MGGRSEPGMRSSVCRAPGSTRTASPSRGGCSVRRLSRYSTQPGAGDGLGVRNSWSRPRFMSDGCSGRCGAPASTGWPTSPGAACGTSCGSSPAWNSGLRSRSTLNRSSASSKRSVESRTARCIRRSTWAWASRSSLQRKRRNASSVPSGRTSRRESSARSPGAEASRSRTSASLGIRISPARGTMALAVLFDLDRTLMDTLASIVEAMNEAAAEVHVVPEFPPDELRPTIGKPVPRQLDELRGISGPIAEAFTDRYYARFTRLVERGVRLYPGVADSFPRLVGRRIGTMSTRRRYQVARMLQAVRLESFFHAIVGGDDVTRPKPSPDLPLLAPQPLGVAAERCAVVGDSPVDILAGHAAGTKAVAALYGYGDPDRVAEARPDATIRSFSELPDALERLES